MNIRERRAIHQSAAHALDRAPQSRQIILVYAAVICGLSLLSTVVSVREKKRKGKKLSDWEREFYNSNREKIDFKTNYTDAEDQLLDLWLGK